jgi:hypothetical protein
MKYSTTAIIIIWFAFTLNSFAQDKIFKDEISKKFTSEKLKETQNPNDDVFQRINDIKSLRQKSQKNIWHTEIRNPKSEFYKEERLNARDTRTTINKTLLDNGFLLLEEYGQRWDSLSSVWVNSSKDSYVYDVNNNQTDWISQFWGGSDWVNFTKHLYAYDENNNQIEDLWYFSFDNSTWVNYSKKSFTYDGNNNLTELLNQAWQDPWANEYKHSYTYDGNNNPTEWLGQDWNGSAWVNSFKKFYTYDGNNNQIEEFWILWDNSAWRNYSKTSYTYDGSDSLTELLTQSWDDSVWANEIKYSYTYDGNNNQIETLWHRWDGFVWINYIRDSYKYDGNNNQTEWLHQFGEDFGWVNNYKYSYTYDENNNQTELLWQSWDGSDWVNGGKSICSYMPTDVKESLDEFYDYGLSNNYPNPFNPTTTIKYQIPEHNLVSIKVFDILGNEIKTLIDREMSPGKYEVSFDASGFSSGIYFYQIKAGDFNQTKKMILLK